MAMVVFNGERAVVSTLAGGVSGTYVDASGTNARLYHPTSVAVDANGNLFVADYLNQRIRKVTADGGTRICPVTLRGGFVDIDVERRRERIGRSFDASPDSPPHLCCLSVYPLFPSFYSVFYICV